SRRRCLRLVGERTQCDCFQDREPDARRRERNLVAGGSMSRTRIAWRAALGAALTAVLALARADDATYRWNLPRGFPEPRVPADNPMSAAKVELGARLFSDPRLSITGRYSCSSCHDPARAFTDGLARSRGATGAELPLNAPTLINAAYNASLGWHDTGITT